MIEVIVVLLLVLFVAVTLTGFILGGFISYLFLRNFNRNHTILNNWHWFVIGGSFFWGLSLTTIWSNGGQTLINVAGFLGLSLLAVPPIYCWNKAFQLKQKKRARRERHKERRMRAERFEKEQLAKGLTKFVDRHGSVKWVNPKKVKELKRIDIGLKDNFSSLIPREFEKFIGNLFRKMGYRVKLTSYTKDYGADILAKNGKDTIVIQVKKYESNSMVGSQEVQRTLGSMVKYKGNKAILVTTSGFTPDAFQMAKDTPIELWDRKKLNEMVEKHYLSDQIEFSKFNLPKDKEMPKEELSRCSECGKEIPKGELLICGECGKRYCPECATKDPTIKELGVCEDCHEVYLQEEDYWGWGEEWQI